MRLAMEILVCIDDTDNMDSPGTGHLADILRHDLEDIFGGKTSRITRHQLHVSDEIPYTSHNSTMCFTADLNPEALDKFISYAQEFLEKNRAEGSDPGLCVAVPDRINCKDKLIKYGTNATRMVLTKSEAVKLAQELEIHLSEHGGTGGGIIGALAGIGLRLGGNNGRFKGWIEIPETDRIITVSALCSRYDIDEVRPVDGTRIDDNEKVSLSGKVKTVLLQHKCVLLVKKSDTGDIWENVGKDVIRRY